MYVAEKVPKQLPPMYVFSIWPCSDKKVYTIQPRKGRYPEKNGIAERGGMPGFGGHFVHQIREMGSGVKVYISFSVIQLP